MTEVQFIEELARLVRKHAPSFGIKVFSPIIAQGILESKKGTSNKVFITKEDGSIEWRHNYFGLKWRDGRCAISNEYFEEITSEQNKDGSYTSMISRFCKFNSLEDCVIGYFQWTNISNYSNLKGVTDPYQYLINIKEDKYATSHDYVDNVYAVIERYNLRQYDAEVKEDYDMSKIKPIVCIDSGHYNNYNKCPNNPNYSEAKVMWDLHLLQKKYLEMLGIEVITTRADQKKDLALHSRGKASKGCDLFISDHTNAVGSNMNESVDYVAIYHLTNDTTTKCDDVSKEVALKLAPVIAEVMGTKQGYKVLTRNSDRDKNGDGMLNDNYYGVLNGARSVGVAGLILEHSFHTNTKMVNWLLNKDNLDKLARAEAECIASYLLKKEVSLNDPKPESPTETKPSETKVLYRVQIGAYTAKSNAEKQLSAVKAKGFDAILVKVGKYYKVQAGAFGVKSNAEALLNKITKVGFKAFITTEGGSAVSEETPKLKSVDEIAKEVIAGKWGNGVTRKNKLTKAGYDYNAVQARVAQLLKK